MENANFENRRYFMNQMEDDTMYRREEFGFRSILNQNDIDNDAEYERRDNLQSSGKYINEQYLRSNFAADSFDEVIESDENYDINHDYLEPVSSNNNKNFVISEDQNDSSINNLNNNLEEKKVERVIKPKPSETILYFQPKIRNSGFWGKVTLRKGTWLVILSLILFVIAIVLIGVFWGLWFGHSVNYPLRILAITLLCMSFTCFVCGMLSNTLMTYNSEYKHFLGSPIRKCSYVLLVSIILIIIAAALMTSYYTYWHNRWVNTPLISVSISFFIIGGIAFYFAMRHNCIQFFKYKYEMFEAEPESLTFQKKSIYNDRLLEERYYDSIKAREQTHSNAEYEQKSSKLDNFRKK